MLKLAIVGSGKIAQEMLPVLGAMPQIEIEVLCGTEHSRDIVLELQGKYQIPRAYTSYSEMLSKESCQVNAVYLAVPNHLHFSLAKEALESGLNVYVEKPFTLKSAEAQELFDLAREKKLYCLEAISNQYLPILGEIRTNLSKVKTIKYVEMNFSQYSSRFDEFMAGEYFRVFDAKLGGGALWDINIYNLHLAVSLFGMPKKATYQANIMRDVDTSGVVTLVYDDFTAVLVGAKDCAGPSQLLIQGTGGYLKVDSPANRLEAPLVHFDVKTKEEEVLFTPVSGVHRMTYEFAELERILREEDWECCMKMQEESLQVCKLTEGLLDS